MKWLTWLRIRSRETLARSVAPIRARGPLRWTRLAVEQLEDRTVPTATWIGGAGDWGNAANWFGATGAGNLPGVNDDVVINVAGNVTITHSQNVTDSIRSLTSDETIQLNAGTLAVALNLSSTGSFQLRGGTLSGANVQNGTTITGTTSGGTLSGVTLGGVLDLTTPSGVTARVVGGLTLNNGSVNLGSNASNYGLLQFDGGNQTLGGTGTVTFGNSPFNFLRAGPTVGSALTIGANILVHGHSGGIGYHTGWGGDPNVTFTNLGTIDADVSGGTITPNGNNWTNSGTLKAENGGNLNLVSSVATSPGWTSSTGLAISGGGSLSLHGNNWTTSAISMTNSTLNLGDTFSVANMGVFTRTGGNVNITGTLNGGVTLDAAFGSWRLVGGTINGGAVTTSGGSVLAATANGGTLAGGVTLDGTFDVSSTTQSFSTATRITGGLTLVTGSIVKIGSNTSNYARLSFDGGNQTLGGTGTIVFGNQTFNQLQVGPTAGSALTIEAGIVIHGQTGVVGFHPGWGDGPNVSVINQGTIDADVAGGSLSLVANSWSSTGTLKAENGANLNLQSLTATAPGWTSSTAIDISGGGTLTLRGNGFVTAGITLNNSTVNLGTPTPTNDAFTQANLGVFTRTGGTVNITGVLSGGLTLDASTGSWMLAGGTINGGTITTSGGAALQGTANAGTLAAGVTLNGLLDVSSTTQSFSTPTRVTGGLTLVAGSVIQIGSNNATYARLAFDGGSQTLGGTGTVLFGNQIFNFLEAGPTSGSVLTIGPNILIHGHSGGIGFHSGWGGPSNAIINQGTIRADVAGGAITINGTNWSNFDDGVIHGSIQAAGGTITMLGSWANSGTIVSAGNPSAISASPIGATEAGTTVTITTDAAHGFIVGQSVVIAGVGVAGYNGTFTITSVPSSTSFTYTASVSSLPASGGGTATLNSTLNLGGNFVIASLGTITSTGGVINLTGVLTNTGTTLTLDGSWQLLGGTINGGTLVTTGGAALVATTSGGSLTNGVTLNGTLDVTKTNAAFLRVTGGLTLNNGLLLVGSATGNRGHISFNGGNQTLGGTGTVVFGSHVGNSLWVGETAGTNLTIGPNILIHGQTGTIGTNLIQLGGFATSTFTNQGTIHADVVGGTIRLEGTGWANFDDGVIHGSVQADTGTTITTAGSWTNAGVITAAANSTVNLGGAFATSTLGTINSPSATVNVTGTLTNNGTLTLNATTNSWQMLGGTIAGGTVVTTGGAALVATTSNGFLTNGVSLDGTLDITKTNAAFITVTGGLNLLNNAVLLVGSATGNRGHISFNGGTQTLGGTGSVLFGNHVGNSLWTGQTAGTNLTIGPNILIHGQTGTVGTNLIQLGGVANSTFTNQGTINADVSGGSIRLEGTNWTNVDNGIVHGSLQVATGATLDFAGSWTNTGVVTAATNGTIKLGGTFATSTLGTFNSSNATVNISGTLTNDSPLTLNATTNSWQLLGGTIVGGTVVTTAGAALIATTSGGALTNGVTINGTLDVTKTNPAFVTVTGGLTLNNGLLLVGSATNNRGHISFNGGSQTLGGTGAVLFGNHVGNSLWTGQTAGTNLTIGPNILIHGQTGTIGTNVGQLGGFTTSTFTNQGTINADVAGGTITLDGLNWSNSGTVQAQNGGTVLTAGTNTNLASGTLTGGTWKVFAGSTLRLISTGVTTNAANIVLDGANSNFYRDTGTTSALANFAANAAAGSFAVQNGRGLTTGVPFSNAGSVTVDATSGASTFTVTGAYTQTAGNTTLVSGGVLTSTTNTVTVSGGTLQGAGTVNGAVTVNTGATISPGASPGILNTSGLTLNAGSTFNVELNGLTAGTGYDQVNVTGNVNLNGATLSASRLASFVPAVGAQLKIINVTGGTVTGTFAQGNSILIGGITFNIDYAGGDGNDVVLSPQPPTVFVDDTWAGTTLGSDPANDPIGGLVFGYNAFSDVQSAIDQAAVNSTVQVYGGTYAGAVNVNKSFVAILTATNSTTSGETLVTWNGPVTLTANTTFNTATADLILNGQIDGASNLSKSGSGKLALTGANTYGGNTTILGGTLQIAADNNLGAGTDVAINGTLEVAGTFSSARTLTLGGANSTIQIDPGQTFTLTTPIGGAGSLTKTGAGTLDLSSLTNTYGGAGQATNVNAGVLRIDADAGLGNAATSLTFNGATLQASGGFTTSRAVTLNAGGGTVDTGAFSVTFASPGVIGGAGGLTKSGAGSLILTGANTYAGGTTINAGELDISADNNLGDSSGGLTINAGTLAVNATFTSARPITLGNVASTIQIANAQTLTVTAAIGGVGGLVKTGAGSLVLSAANTFAAAVSIDSGAVFVNASIVSGVTVNNSGALAGNGSIGGSVTVNTGGAVSPGTPTTAGLLSIAGGYTQNAGASLNINIGGQSTPGVGYDAVAISGAASLDGAINVTIVNGFTPATNDGYAILSFGSVTGEFATRSGFSLGNNQFLVESFTPAALNLVVDLQPIITSANNVTFPQTLFRTFTVTATGVPTPSFNRTGALPTGVSFVDNNNGTATLSGTPILGSLGDYPLTITASNGVGSNFVQNFTLSVGIPLPVSSVSVLPAFSPAAFLVSWSGTDEGGPGIASYDIFVSDNGGPFTLFQNDTTQTSATFNGQNGHTYGFYSVAVDTVGNAELPPASAQTSTQVDTLAPTSSVAALPAFSPGSFNVSWAGNDSGPAGIASYDVFVSDNGSAFTLFQNDTTLTSANFIGQNGHVYGFYSVATDRAGNVQTTPAGAQASTQIDTAAPTSNVTVLAAFSTASFNVSWSGSDVGGSGVASFDIFVSDNGAAASLLLDDTTATSTTFNGAAGHTYAFFSVATDNIGNQEANPPSADTQTRTAVYTKSLTAITEDATAPTSIKVSDLLTSHFADPNPNPKPGIAVVQTSGTGAWQYSADGVTFTSFGTVGLGKARLLSSTYRVRFLPAKNATGPAQLFFAGWDGSIGTAGGVFAITGVGVASAFSVDVGLLTEQVNAVNDAPTWTATASTVLLPSDTVALAQGKSVAEVAGSLFSDVDGNANVGIAVVGLTGATPSAFWEYSTNAGVSWNALSVSATAARVLNANDRIRFGGGAILPGKVTIQARAWDASLIPTGGIVNLSGTGKTGGVTAFSANVLTVTAFINSAPSLSTPVVTTLSTNEDKTSALVPVTSLQNVASQGIAIVGATGPGTWQYTLDGTTFLPVGAVSATQGRLLASTAKLRFVPAANQSGNTGGLTYRAWNKAVGASGSLFAISGGASAFSSAAGTLALTVNAINDAPTWSATAQPVAFLPNQTAFEAGKTVAEVAGSLFRDADGTTIFGVAVVGVTGTWKYSTDNGASWLSLTATAKLARLLSAIDKIQYLPGLNLNAKGTIQLRAWDGVSGTPGQTPDLTLAGATGGATAFSANVLTATAFANDAPTLNNPAPPALTATSEDKTSAAFSVQTLCNAANANVTDTTGALKGIAVVGATGPGTWQYALDGKTFIAMGAVTPTLARLLPSSASVRFVPAANQNGPATLIYRGWDQTAGTSGALFTLTGTGGATPFSDLQATSTLAINSVNDAPVLNTAVAPLLTPVIPGTPDTNIPGDLVSSLLGGVTDADAGDARGIAVVALGGITTGRWDYSTDGGANWNLISPVSTTSALLLQATDRIRYVPNASFIGKATLSFKAWDQTSGLHNTKGPTTGPSFSTAVGIATVLVNMAPVLS